jgi:signal transduction histidine kinase
MKLLTKTSLFFITIALFTLFLGGIAFYVSFRLMINREVRRELINDMHQFLMHPPPGQEYGTDTVKVHFPSRYEVIPIKTLKNTGFVFSDTLLYDNLMHHYQSYRIISIETRLNQKPVRISISKSMLISNELVAYVAFITLILSVFLLVCLVLFNNFFLSRIWRSFFNTLTVIKDFSITDKKDLNLPETEIAEFGLLNQVLEKMHGRIRKDYDNLEEFIENVSHEIQTPLAIISSKADLLLQDEKMGPDDLRQIQSIRNNVARLSNLNRSLILLAKIDNHQFPAREKVEITHVINFHLENFDDVLIAKKIYPHCAYKNPIHVMADPGLINIMLLNLLKNAIYHNLHAGKLDVTVDEKVLTIRNSGKNPEMEGEELFKRFVKTSERPDSLGLGLSITKKICDYYNFSISYTFTEGLHCISIGF